MIRDFSREFLKSQRLLVISPHADDETIGSGGLMARVKEAGGMVFVLVFSVGDLQHFDAGHTTVTKETRESELKEALNVLEVDDHEIIFRDTSVHLKLDVIPRHDLTGWIEKKARLSTQSVQPTMIVLPAPSYNQDHEAIYKAGITACRPHLPTSKSFQNVVLVADAPQLAWSGPLLFKPNFYIDISGKFLETKIKAYECHKTQVRPDPSHASIDALKLLALARGREISVEAAEAYECLRFVI
jgi:LmbE family N-acetylglucosaminyl deacetylase